MYAWWPVSCCENLTPEAVLRSQVQQLPVHAGAKSAWRTNITLLIHFSFQVFFYFRTIGMQSRQVQYTEWIWIIKQTCWLRGTQSESLGNWWNRWLKGSEATVWAMWPIRMFTLVGVLYIHIANCAHTARVSNCLAFYCIIHYRWCYS